jgi:hypothetical protein
MAHVSPMEEEEIALSLDLDQDGRRLYQTLNSTLQ